MQNYHEHSDFTYFNISIANQGTSNIDGQVSEFITPATIQKYNDRALVRDTTDKVLSVERINISTAGVPIFIGRPIDKNNQSIDPRLIQKLGITYDNGVDPPVIVEKNLKYISSSDPFTPSFWWVFTYTVFVRMVNETFKELVSDLGLLISLPVNFNTPYIEFSTEAQLFSLIAQIEHFDNNLSTAYFKINCNAYTQQKLDALDGKYNTINSTPNDNIFQFSIVDLKNNTIDQSGIPKYKMTQNYNILNKWNSLKAIRISSNFAIENEFIDNGFSQITTSAGQTTSQNILKDFTINYSEFSSTGRTEVSYSSREREYLSLLPHQSITNIFIQIFWVDELGVAYPLGLNPNETALIKFLVKRKDMNF